MVLILLHLATIIYNPFGMIESNRFYALYKVYIWGGGKKI